MEKCLSDPIYSSTGTLPVHTVLIYDLDNLWNNWDVFRANPAKNFTFQKLIVMEGLHIRLLDVLFLFVGILMTTVFV